MAARLSPSWRLAPFEKTPRQYGPQIKAFFRTLAGRILAVTVVCWFFAFIYCRYQFWRDPHSAFFDSDAAYDMHYTSVRQAEAKSLIDSAATHSNSSYTPSSNPTLCAGVISVKRKEIQYLNETVGSMLAGLTDEERRALSVNVFFADIDPADHPDYNGEWLKLVDFWGGYDVSEETLEQLREYKKNKKIRAKALFDYVYMLDQCYNKTTAPYIAILEDDIIFADSWLAKTLPALTDIEHKSTTWLYLRLFWTDVMLGWDKDIDSWYTNPIFNYITALAVTYALAFYYYKRLKHTRANIDMNAFIIITCVTFPAFFTLVFMIGRNSLMPLEGLQRMDVKGCCTQALIYPRSQVQDLADMLLRVDPDQTDLIIKDYANELGLARYALAPQLVQHVGLVSSRGTKMKNSRTNWAFYFEKFNAKKLRKEHDELIKSGILKPPE